MKINKDDKNKHWLKEGKQSKQTKSIKDICKKFDGESDVDKIIQILIWIDKNLRYCKNKKNVERIFATRTAEEIIKNKEHTGCHDTALIFVTMTRSCGIPCKYIAGLGKETGTGGHCVSKVFVNNKWLLIDQSRYRIDIFPENSDFYRKFYIMGEGLDSWDIKIKTLKDWYKKADQINNKIKR